MAIVIRLWSFTIKDNVIINAECELMMPFSTEWSDLREFEVTSSPRKYTHIWNFKEDCNCRQGIDVEKRLNIALSTLERHGIYPSTRDTLLEDDKHVSPRVFAYHLVRLLKLAVHYPTCYFIDQTDYVSPLIQADGTVIDRIHPDNKPIAEDELHADMRTLQNVNEILVQALETVKSTRCAVIELPNSTLASKDIKEDQYEDINSGVKFILTCFSIPIILALFLRST